LETRKIEKFAAALFVPCAAWLAFAAFLNEEIVCRNPDAEKMILRPALYGVSMFSIHQVFADSNSVVRT
jgi:hypothetical protein